MSTSTVAAPSIRLDSCDRCTAAAMIRVLLATRGELQFCGHHARQHARKLLEIGARLRSML